MQLTAGDTLGVYRIAGLIGAGGMGEVYRARDTRLDRDIALKAPPTRQEPISVVVNWDQTIKK